MGGRKLAERLRRLTLTAVLLYAFVLALTPFEHHDLLCHLKTPQHCGSCASNTAGLHSHAPTVLDGHQFSDAGRAFAAVATGDDVLLVSSSSGRSPPASL
jgi:hypothetical protein